MNKSKIDWPWNPLYTWNPVVGCKHGCNYCYARRMNQRFKWIDKWENPEYFVHRVSEPVLINKPRNIFVGSMCDLFGEWITSEYIQNIIHITEGTPQHTYFFLTKNPRRYAKFNFPGNCWLGVTLTSYKCEDTKRFKVNDWFSFKFGHQGIKLFASIEPLLGTFEDVCFLGIDQVIVGAMTGSGATEPKPEWIESIKAEKIHYKKNILKYL